MRLFGRLPKGHMKLVLNRVAPPSSLRLRAPSRSERMRGRPAGRPVACAPCAGRPAPAEPPRSGGTPGTFALDGVWPRLSWPSYVADGACVVGDVVLGADSSVWFCAVIRADNGPIRIGSQTNVQDGAIVHCLPDGEVVIGGQVSIGHLATIHGARIGDRCLVGMNAVVMDGASVSHDTLIAAGSIVPGGRSFEPGVLLQGTPARVVRRLTDRELAGIRANALQYVARAERFRVGLQRSSRS